MPRSKKKIGLRGEKKKRSKPKKHAEPVIEITPEDAQNLQYIKLINKIRKSDSQTEVDDLFQELLKPLKPRIFKIVSKFRIPGLDYDDVFQESLYALKFKAIKDYDRQRGSGEGPASFERFAVLCIRRHLATEFKASFQNKRKVLNTSASLDQESNGGDDDLALINIVPSSDGDVVSSIQNNELSKIFLTTLMQSLSGFEKEVFSQHANGDSYADIARKIKEKRPDLQVKVKSIDNALSRIKNKAKTLVESNDEFKALIPPKRKRLREDTPEGDNDEIQDEG